MLRTRVVLRYDERLQILYKLPFYSAELLNTLLGIFPAAPTPTEFLERFDILETLWCRERLVTLGQAGKSCFLTVWGVFKSLRSHWGSEGPAVDFTGVTVSQMQLTESSLKGGGVSHLLLNFPDWKHHRCFLDSKG